MQVKINTIDYYQQVAEKAIEESLYVRSIKEGCNLIKKGKYLNLYSMKYKNYKYNLVKIEGEIPVNFEIASQYYYEENEAQKQVRNNIEDIKSIETLDEDNCIILVTLKSKLGIVSQRQVLGLQHRRKLNSNEIVIVRGNTDEHPNAPRKKNVIRAEGNVYAIFLTFIDQNTTRFEAYLLLDPKGHIPVFVVNHVVVGLLDEFEKDIKNMFKQRL